MIWHEMFTYVYMSLCIDQRSHGKAERSGIETARPAIVFTLGFNLTLSTLGTGWHEFQISWIVNQQLEPRKETKQSQVLRRRYTELVVVWIGSGSVWIRVWIGLGPRPRIGPTFLRKLQLGCSVTRKGRQGEQLDCMKAWQSGFTAVCCLAAWQGE